MSRSPARCAAVWRGNPSGAASRARARRPPSGSIRRGAHRPGRRAPTAPRACRDRRPAARRFGGGTPTALRRPHLQLLVRRRRVPAGRCRGRRRPRAIRGYRRRRRARPPPRPGSG
ncbi:MAG: hypothetical protein E6G43_09490 [Actinobacteria bacterium]|nr:MAG: hypothetical protein E6G43_09490 [Actinomycetota bacterium]